MFVKPAQPYLVVPEPLLDLLQLAGELPAQTAPTTSATQSCLVACKQARSGTEASDQPTVLVQVS